MSDSETLERVEAVPTAVNTGAPVTVTPDNFRRAESHRFFGSMVSDGAFGRLYHNREPTPIDHQPVVRLNRDTLYSCLVVDLDAGPATVTLPDPGPRFMSIQVIDEDQYCPMVAYAPCRQTLTREGIGTRYALVGVRTLADPASAEDLKAVQGLQDAIQLEQAAPGRFETPAWDKASQDKVRRALMLLGETLPDSHRTFGRRDEVDPVRHLIGTAIGWGGNPEADALYDNLTPAKNDGTTVHRLHVPAQVPVDGFWSVTVYNQEGYFTANPEGAYSVNNLTARKNADGSVDIQFGGEAGGAPNRLPITPGWNVMVRLYRPRPEVLSGAWRFPEPEPVV